MRKDLVEAARKYWEAEQQFDLDIRAAEGLGPYEKDNERAKAEAKACDRLDRAEEAAADVGQEVLEKGVGLTAWDRELALQLLRIPMGYRDHYKTRPDLGQGRVSAMLKWLEDNEIHLSEQEINAIVSAVNVFGGPGPLVTSLLYSMAGQCLYCLTLAAPNAVGNAARSVCQKFGLEVPSAV